MRLGAKFILVPTESRVLFWLTYHLISDFVLLPQGLSGRTLRKLPFLAHAALASPYSCDPSKFLCTMIDTARIQRSELLD